MSKFNHNELNRIMSSMADLDMEEECFKIAFADKRNSARFLQEKNNSG